MKTVLIEFDDSMFVQGGWLLKEDTLQYQHKTKCVAIGVILTETPDIVEVCPYLAPLDVAKAMIIPKSSIKRMRNLKVG